MASTRLQQAQLLSNQLFLGQLAGSLLNAAAQVLNEAASTANHVNRIAYARSIIASPMAAANFMAPGMLTNSTIAANAGSSNGASGTPETDNDVDFVVASLFDTYANQLSAQSISGPPIMMGS